MANETENDGRLWKLFSSMKFGLFLLGLIAILSALGTMFPQISQEPEKAKTVGAVWQSLGFTHLYSTVWFRLLLGLLSLNLIICSAQRFGNTYSKAFKTVIPSNVNGIPKKVGAVITGRYDSLQQSVEQVIKGSGYQFTSREVDGVFSFAGIRHRWGYWGSLVTHLAFVVLLGGTLLGSLGGFKGYFMAGAGEELSIRNIEISKGSITSNFSVRVNSAEDRFLNNGERDNWYTDLSVIENGREVARQTLSVNHPFTYQGVTFYQSDFAQGARFTVTVKEQKNTIILRDQGESYYQIPDTDLYLVAARIQNYSGKPQVYYQVFKGQDAKPVQSGQLMAGQSFNVQGNYQATFEGVAGITGLQVKKDPGVWVIWLGCALLLLGLLLSFYWRPRTILGILEAGEGNQGTLTVGAGHGKDMGTLRKEFDDLAKKLKKGMDPVN